MFCSQGFSLAVLPSFFLSACLALASSYLLHGTGPKRFTPPRTMDEVHANEEGGMGSGEGTRQKGGLSPTWLVLRNPTVVFVCVAIMAHAGAQGFTDTTLGQHIQMSKGADTSGSNPLRVFFNFFPCACHHA